VILGTPVVILKHPQWRGGKLWGYEGDLLGRSFQSPTLYVIRFDWLKKFVYLPRECFSPVYQRCSTHDCNYAAWSAINRGDDDHPDYYHYCVWHIKLGHELARLKLPAGFGEED